MKHLWRLLGATTLVLLVFALPAAATPDQGRGKSEGKGNREHNLEGPLGKKRNALRQAALEAQLNGKIPTNAKVANVAKGQFVELAREGEDAIWTVAGEFGTQQATHNHGALGTINHGGDEGPLHNEIPEPDRDEDNTTIWTDDFSEGYYENLLFGEGSGVNSMRQFYIEQSSNRYAVNGDVTDWVKVPFNSAAYGSNYCGSIVCVRDIRRFLEDSLSAWYAEASTSMTAAQIDAYLSRFDKWDRYDYDGDGNFDEADGYIDHFQSLHAGVGEETGGGSYGEDAIWSHRSYSNTGNVGSEGPAGNPLGGVRVGTSSYWVGDYTIEPENGGVGVFAHEYAHDLGIPDLYDTSGNTGGAENSTGFWTTMSSGSYGNDGTVDIGSKPTGFGNWEKFQLGWLKYDVARAGRSSVHKLGASIGNTKQAQGLFVILPASANPSTTVLGTPTSPANAWYSTAGDNLDVSMTRDVTLPAGGGPIGLSMNAWYEIESCWDYAYVRVSQDGGTTYTNLATNVSDSGNENDQNFGNGITGISGTPKDCALASGSPTWVPVSADLTPYAGKTIKLQIRYWTDGAVVGRGFEFDDLSITAGSTTVFSDNAESGDNGWTLAGFRRTAGTETRFNAHYYVAENRQYVGYDAGLKTGPYNFGFLNTLPDYAERFPYQDGLLINYWDTGQSDNNVGDHPGEGLILPVDARPAIMHWADGQMMRPRLQSFDSTFGLQATDAITLHKDGVGVSFASSPGVPVFDDRQDWWAASDGDATHGVCPADNPGCSNRYVPGWSGVNVPKTGTTVRVVSESTGAQGAYMQVEVNVPKK